MKHKLITKTLTLSTLLGASTCALASVSCGPNYDKLFFSIHGKDLDVTFCDRGASIYSIKYKNKYITYHPKDKETFLQDDFYYGKTLGRVAGRIPDGKLKIDGTEYQLEVNETAGEKNNSLHGGVHSFTTKDFTREVVETPECYDISFSYVSPDGEAGYPGTVSSKFVYTIYKEKNTIDLHITATTTKKTALDLGTHPFFRLSEDGNILNHYLTIPASNMGKFNFDEGTQIVEGEQNVTTDPDFKDWNFTSAKKIGDDIEDAATKDRVSGGYDHVWKFDETSSGLHTVTLANPGTGLSLNVTTDATGIIMYANCFPKENQEMNPGGLDTKYAAITVEPYTFFTRNTVEDALCITPDQTFTRYISYQING